MNITRTNDELLSIVPLVQISGGIFYILTKDLFFVMSLLSQMSIFSE